MSGFTSTGELSGAIAQGFGSIYGMSQNGLKLDLGTTDSIASAIGSIASTLQIPLQYAGLSTWAYNLGLGSVVANFASYEIAKSQMADAQARGDANAYYGALCGAISSGFGVIAGIPGMPLQFKGAAIALNLGFAAVKELIINGSNIKAGAQQLWDDISSAWDDWSASPQYGVVYDPSSPFGVRIDINTYFQTALTPPRRDPLAIDLDADGIETIGLPTLGAPTLFDHDADGIKTGTGWLKGDDAWLVLDRNANGKIDTGRELFGVDTLITVTEKLPGASVATTFTRNATNGFEALRSLDANADSVFNASDAAFGQVRLWQDLNQDGISQSAELFTLAAKGITAIALNPTASATNLGNGNTVTGVATVTRGSGSTTIDSVDLSASNLDLGANPFYREFTDAIPLTDTARALPEMGGSGVLRDLREAMSLGTPQAAALAAAVQAFAQAGTRDEQVARLDTLIEAWAQTGQDVDAALRSVTGNYGLLTSTGTGNGQAAFNSLFGAKLDALGLSWRGLLANADFRGSGSTFNADTQALIDMARNAGVLTEVRAVSAGTALYDTYVGTPLYQGIDSLTGLQRHIAVLDAFNGMGVLNRVVAPGPLVGGVLRGSTLGVLWPGGNALMAANSHYYGSTLTPLYATTRAC